VTSAASRPPLSDVALSLAREVDGRHRPNEPAIKRAKAIGIAAVGWAAAATGDNLPMSIHRRFGQRALDEGRRLRDDPRLDEGGRTIATLILETADRLAADGQLDARLAGRVPLVDPPRQPLPDEGDL
jgi:hypothetical protein